MARMFSKKLPVAQMVKEFPVDAMSTAELPNPAHSPASPSFSSFD
jgi:hypothetical protein